MGWGEEEEEEAFALSLAGQITEKYEFGAAAAVLATRKGGRGSSDCGMCGEGGERASSLGAVRHLNYSCKRERYK